MSEKINEEQKKKIQDLHKQVKELLDKEGYELYAMMHFLPNGILALPMILPKKDEPKTNRGDTR